METKEVDRIKELTEMIYNEHHEAIEGDDSQFPYTLVVILGLAIIMAAVMLVIFFAHGNTVVTETLGTHFQKR
jgi:hypothetical protein